MRKKKYNKNKIRTSGGIKFLGIIFFLYFIIFLVNPIFIRGALIETGKMLLKMMPILVLVFVMMIVVNTYVSKEKIKKHLGSESGIKGWLWAIGAGILISGPPYLLFPLLKEMKKKGMKDSLVAVLLYNRNVKIPFLPLMIFYFGLPFTIISSVYLIIFSVFNGWLVNYFLHQKNKH